MNHSKTKPILIAAIAASVMVAATASAQNPNYTPGDLVLAFQNPGGTTGSDQTLYVSLGNTAIFRGAAAGADGPSLLNIVNINAQLISAFGSNWASELTLYAGLAGVWGNSSSSLNNTLQNGDPHRTLYVSQGRTGTGILGQANSPGWTITTDGGMTAGANGIIAQNTAFELNYTTAVAVSPTDISTIDEQNPFNAPGDQGTAFGSFIGGVQQAGTATSLGSFGSIANAEFELDLYRILAKTNAAGQVGGVLREGSYEGTVVVDTLGNVSFLSVPEPSSLVILGASIGLLGFTRRRRA